MPALPTGNMTHHVDASHTGNIWVNYQAGTPFHNTTPSDGSFVGAWDDEQGNDQQWKTVVDGVERRPIWRQSIPILKEPCLDFNPTIAVGNGADYLHLTNNAGTSNIALSALITNAAFTILMSFVIEAASANNGFAYTNHCLFGDHPSVFMGLFVRNNSGQIILQGYNWDGSEDKAERNISLNTPHVAMFRHQGGNLYLSVDGGAEASVASGNTQTLTGNPQIGFVPGAFPLDGRVGEVAIYNAALTGSTLQDAIDYFVDKWIIGRRTQPQIMVIN